MGQEASYQNLYAAFSRQCQQTAEKVTLCGLSLGAVLALNYAIDHPEGVEALVLIAPQYKMPKKLLWLQNLMFRFMPESQFQETGFKKKDFVSLCQTAAVLDFTDSLGRCNALHWWFAEQRTAPIEGRQGSWQSCFPMPGSWKFRGQGTR